MNLTEELQAEAEEESSMEYTVYAILPEYGLIWRTFQDKETAIAAAKEANGMIARYWEKKARGEL